MLPLLKILTPKVIKSIMNYVFEKNDLDQQMEIMQIRVAKLENLAHPMRDFVLCDNCKCKIKEK